VTKIKQFENSRWQTAAILKMVLSLYLGRYSSDFNEIWCADAVYFQGRPSEKMIKFCKFKMTKSQELNCPITAKFGRKKHNHGPTDHNIKFRKFKMADGRHLKNGFIAVTLPGIIWFHWNLVHRRIIVLARTATLMWDAYRTMCQIFVNSKWRTAIILKIVFRFYLNDILSD